MSFNQIRYSAAAAILIVAAACTKPHSKLDVSFTITPDESNPNFALLEADELSPSAVYEWDVAGVPYSGRKTVVYVDRKGIHDITLTVSDGEREGSAIQKFSIPANSVAFEAGEMLVWSDEFLDRPVDTRKWNFDQGTGKWGNNELENYTSRETNAFIRDGRLVIRAEKTGDGDKVGDYTSARLNTRGKLEINRGRVEVRARLAGGRGTWPAIWMYGTAAAPYYTELDIMEYVGCDKNIIYGTVWNSAALSDASRKVSASMTVNDVEEQFHVYGMDWNDDGISFYLDHPSNVYLKFTPGDKSDMNEWPFDKPLYLILNLAVGGDWGGMKGIDYEAFPAEMEVDYVRVFQKK